MKIKVNKNVVVISLCILVLLIAGSISYAYFTAGVLGNEEAKEVNVTTGTMNLVYSGENQLNMANALPGATQSVTFTIKNTGSLPAIYSVDIIDVVNNFADKNDLVYSLSSDNAGGSKSETVVPSTNGTLIPVVGINPGITQTYTLTIHFKETGDNQNDNQGKMFSGKIQINNDNSNTLVANIVANSKLNTTIPDFSNIPDEENSGLFKTEDDDGTSYYFRGNVDNNYVDLGTTYSETVSGAQKGDKMLWRVVRINGDGTIRLVTDNIVSKKAFNAISSGYKYVGYTYDNSAANVQDGTNSTIKDYLENEWYPAVIEASLENLITSSNYCNDTSISYINSNTYFYQGRTRINNYNPTLKCPETAQTYGGKYKLKVGLLSTDEMILAGYLSWNDESSSQSNYLWNSNIFWSLSPSDSTTTYANSFFGNSSDNVNRENVENIYGVRPVISLKADTQIISGNGSVSNPYVVSD